MATCHGCADTFGFWKRNAGCPKCGFSYCQKCVRFRLHINDAERKEKILLVCQKCFMQSQQDTTEGQDDTGGTLHQERTFKAMEVLEAMDNPSKPPITLYRESNRVAALKRGLSTEDQKIVDRLEELRGIGRRRKSEPIEEEVELRLAKLKDQPIIPVDNSVILKSKPETEADLISRLTSEVNLDKKYEDNVVDDIEQRLNRLRGHVPSTPPERSSDGNRQEFMSEEDEADQIMRRYTAEAQLEKSKKDQKENNSDDGSAVSIHEDSSDDEDLDYEQRCRICEEKRATVSCSECDGDIFCTHCFQEFHEELGETHNPSRICKPAE